MNFRIHSFQFQMVDQIHRNWRKSKAVPLQKWTNMNKNLHFLDFRWWISLNLKKNQRQYPYQNEQKSSFFGFQMVDFFKFEEKSNSVARVCSKMLSFNTHTRLVQFWNFFANVQIFEIFFEKFEILWKMCKCFLQWRASKQFKNA